MDVAASANSHNLNLHKVWNPWLYSQGPHEQMQSEFALVVVFMVIYLGPT